MSVATPWRHRSDVVATLVSREFKGRYKNTAIGMAWSVVSPLMFLFVFYFLFKRILDLGIPNYASFTFIGIIAWMWFQGTLGEATKCISSNASLVGQPGFPIGTLPIVAVTSNLINFLIAMPLLVGLLILEGPHLSPSLMALPIIIATQFILSLSLSYIVAAVNVHFRDTQYILPIILQLGYYVTPIFYNMERVPPEYRYLFAFNPMVPIVESYRAILLYGRWPQWESIMMVTALAVVMLYFGHRYFQHASYRFLEEL